MKISRQKTRVDPYTRGRWSYEKRKAAGGPIWIKNKYELVAAFGKPDGCIGTLSNVSMYPAIDMMTQNENLFVRVVETDFSQVVPTHSSEETI